MECDRQPDFSEKRIRRIDESLQKDTVLRRCAERLKKINFLLLFIFVYAFILTMANEFFLCQ